MEKNLKKGFYFGWGNDNFGQERELNQKLNADLRENEGCGIAFIANKHFIPQNVKSSIKFLVTNHSQYDVTIRIEKKFFDGVKTSYEKIEKNSKKQCNAFLSDSEKNSEGLKEIVIAVLRCDNSIYPYTISLKAEID